MVSAFAKILSISIAANWMILAVLVLRFLLKKAPRRVICILWAMVAVRMLLPVSLESPVDFIPETTSAIQEAVDISLIHPETVTFHTEIVTPQEGISGTSASSGQSISVIPLVWFFGVLLMLSYLALRYIKLRRLVREAAWEKENIWICDTVTTPFILGIVRPKIYLPSGLSGTSREYVIAHEKCHLRCKDHWWKPISYLILSVFWFDPLMWIAYFMICKDIEFACDESVIHRYSLSEKKAYSQALLTCSTNRKLVLACPIAFGETAVVGRIRNVLNHKKPGFWIMLVSVLILILCTIGFFTIPVGAQTNDSGLASSEQIEVISTLPPAESQDFPSVQENPEEWENFPDGIRIDTYTGETFTARVMIVRDPAKVYLAASSNPLSMDTPGIPIDEALEQENAIAAVNAGPYFDDGTSSRAVGSVPLGLALSGDDVIWDDEQSSQYGFVGFNKDNILIVASSMTEEKAKELEIRDGCSSGPVLMINGKVNWEIYESRSGFNPRTVIGQRADGAVLLICAQGRNPGSVGADYNQMIDILKEYGAVNACALQGGSASNMLYRDVDGRYGEKGTVQIFNQYSLAPSLRRLPLFWIVKSA